MFATPFFQQINHWLPTLSRLTRPARAAALAEQIIVQPDDVYFLAAGAYQVRVLNGHLWLPDHGILAAGTRHDLRVDWQGVEIRPATARPIVFTVCLQLASCLQTV